MLDEHLSPVIAQALRDRGLDVVAVGDRPDLIGASDRMVLDTATDEERAVVTDNVKDFRPLAVEFLARGRIHGGLILLPSARSRTKGAVGALVSVIASIMKAHPDGIAGGEEWVGPLNSP
jgi:hypothetical protein